MADDKFHRLDDSARNDRPQPYTIYGRHDGWKKQILANGAADEVSLSHHRLSSAGKPLKRRDFLKTTAKNWCLMPWGSLNRTPKR
jgi:hypothetical protein